MKLSRRHRWNPFRSKKSSSPEPQVSTATVVLNKDAQSFREHREHQTTDQVSAATNKNRSSPPFNGSSSGPRDTNEQGHSRSRPPSLTHDTTTSKLNAAADDLHDGAVSHDSQARVQVDTVPSANPNRVPQIVFSPVDSLPVSSQHSQSQQDFQITTGEQSQQQTQYAQQTSNVRPSSARSRSSSRTSSVRSETSEDKEILPQTVSCMLHIKLDDKVLQQPKEQVIRWFEEQAFKDLSDAAEDCVKRNTDLLHTNLALAEFYLRNGSCRVIGRKHRMDPRRLEDGLQIVEVLVIAICGFIHDYPYESFHLEINWDYSTICVKEIEGKAYKDVIRSEIYRKIKRNYQGKAYISRTDLINILSPETSRLIIADDNSLPLEAKETLIAEVRSRAENLQAACVYARLPMRCLQRLLDKGFHDKDRPREKSDCPQEEGWDWDVDFGNFLDNQASFFAYKFPPPTEAKDQDHDLILDDVVVPISYNPADTALGEGAFSIVYDALVDPVHHYFSEDKTQHFALKKFKERKKENATFDRELEMLKQLKRYPHPHIVTHLFTWTQQETFYMLFPKASCNLRDYMTKQPLRDPLATSSPSGSHVYIPPDQSMRCPLLDATFVTWLLRQLLGLAEAIDHIHHLIGDAVQVPVQLAPSSARGPGTRATGFHHDIKPDNILVFTDGSDYYGTFKIGDFGSGRLNTFRSGTQRSPFEERSLGTPTYEGPDLYLLGTASRPYDLWSLGCVFLDILLWCFNPGQGGAENFATERGEAMPDQPNYQTDRFWYPSGGEGSAKRALLKDAVKKRIQDLAEHHCKGRRAFEKLISLVKRMFEIDARKRITATQLKSDVEAILRQAEIDLDSEPNCYIRAADFDALPESSIPIPRTPSTIPSRRPSLREINTANFGPQLSPLDAQSPPDLYRRRSESIGRLQTAFTSNTGGHLSQSVAVQEDGLADPLRDGRSQEQQQSFVRPWADNDVFGPKLESP